jgi:death-on-curing protein
MMFITLQEIIEDQAALITKYGGMHGLRDLGLLASAIEMPMAAVFGEELHPTIFDKAAAYLFHIIRNHPFIDGNKRAGTLAALAFLRQNDVHIQFSEEEAVSFEELVVNTANGHVTKEEIAKFLNDCYSAAELQ